MAQPSQVTTSVNGRRLSRAGSHDSSESSNVVPVGSPVLQQWKKYHHYDLDVDHAQDDKAREILLCTFSRPHMRAFHCAWWSFFIAFFIWFAISPLLPQIKVDLKLTKGQIWTSSIAGVGSTVIVRLIMGPMCDLFGARILFSVILCLASIPTACTGLIQDATGLIVLRSFIGIAGGTFVMCEYWTSRMFTKEVVGTANALVAGWGNLGAGITQLLIGSYLFPLFRMVSDDAETAWRTVCIVPAVVAFITGIVVYRISDDSPKGNYTDLKSHGVFRKVNATTSFSSAAWDINTVVLFIQYACCFGVELTMNNAAAMYFHDEFGQSTEAAAAMASIFGWLNLFARGLGGMWSDDWNWRCGMRGRLWAQTLCLLAEGAMVLIFAQTQTLGASIFCLVVFSLFVQAAEGTSFGIVPYVNPMHMGSVCGIVGAGGNIGAVGFGLAFKTFGYGRAFHIMGACVLASSVLSVFIRIKGYSGLLWGEDEMVDPETGKIHGLSNDSDHLIGEKTRRSTSESQAVSKSEEFGLIDA